jgi:hypothetical protein
VRCSICQRVVRLRDYEDFSGTEDENSAEHFLESIIALDAVMKMQRLQKDEEEEHGESFVQDILNDLLASVCGQQQVFMHSMFDNLG